MPLRVLPNAGPRGNCGRDQNAVPPIRASKNGRWRALALVLVHGLVAVHVAHWMRTGSTLSPLEPSEAMEFSKHDIVNAGFVFFGLTILSTLVLGRWFCGWACHVVALQDLSLWLLRRVGIRPKPLRSRWLGFVPLLAALYMFAYPLAYRLWQGQVPGTPRLALTKVDFWATFPPWPVALATFAVCGFAIVYFLGAKGFCTYGCPYGAIFGLADRFAPGRIRVTDACEGCGHCTATCTSNVLVHLEVARYGMVVDPGCMKCMDCVSVCPKEALYFGFGAPSLGAKARDRSDAPTTRRAKSGLPLGHESLLAGAFLGSFLVYRGLYGAIPFLLALGLSGILAFCSAELVQVLRRPSRSVLGRSMKQNGRLTPSGVGFVLAMTGILALSVHSALIQFHIGRGERGYEALRARREAFLVDPARRLADEERSGVERARASLIFVLRYGLLSMPQTELRLAWLQLFLGSPDEFERTLGAVAATSPDASSLHYDLARFHEARGETEAAAAAYEASLAVLPAASVFDRLARLRFRKGESNEALAVFRRALEAFPESDDLLFNQGIVQAMTGREQEAAQSFRKVLEIDPGRIDARENLAGILSGQGRHEEAQRVLRGEQGSGIGTGQDP